MPTWILDQFIKEWAVIKQAPITFATLFLLALGLAFLIARWLYKEALSRKDDLIEDLRKKPPVPTDNTNKESEQSTRLLKDGNARLLREKAAAEEATTQA